jgi:hypothetical protein
MDCSRLECHSKIITNTTSTFNDWTISRDQDTETEEITSKKRRKIAWPLRRELGTEELVLLAGTQSARMAVNCSSSVLSKTRGVETWLRHGRMEIFDGGGIVVTLAGVI